MQNYTLICISTVDCKQEFIRLISIVNFNKIIHGNLTIYEEGRKKIEIMVESVRMFILKLCGDIKKFL